MTDQSVWKFMSLADWQYKHFCNTITLLLSEVNNLILIQESGHVPLILSQQNDTVYQVAISPGTLDVLTQIDSTFALFGEGAVNTPFNSVFLDAYKVLLGNKETFRIYMNKRSRNTLLQDSD